jgi:pimeloyl-ACP methyl ester carboxylesterase
MLELRHAMDRDPHPNLCCRSPDSRQKPMAHPSSRRGALAAPLALFLLLFLTGCATPIRVDRVGAREVHRELTSNVISTGDISPDSQIVLQQRGLWQYYQSDPTGAIALLHQAAAAEQPDSDVLFALAEMSFRRAEDTGVQADYLAATIYAYAFLFPNDRARQPNEFDPRVRIASDVYNRSLTSAFESPDSSLVGLQSGTFALPFGTIHITFNQESARWGHLVLSVFTPADELRVHGLRSIYTRHGLGAPLAAETTSNVNVSGFQVEPGVKVPVTALLRLGSDGSALTSGHLQGRIDVYPAFEPSAVEIAGQSVPLEVEITAAFAFGLSDPKVWESEYAGFLNGDFFHQTAAQLVALEPYRPDQIPVIFIHGTASSPGRWADLINDLQSDPAIRENCQFWSFTYASGSPTAFSAMQLRIAIEEAVQKLDPDGNDPVLKRMVLIGHSQGGLIAKLLVIDSGSRLWDALSREPLDQLRISASTHELLRKALFVTPVPGVRRVIFIATPQHGSFVAGSAIGQLLAGLVTPPSSLTTALRDVTEDNPKALKTSPSPLQFGSLSFMTPGSPLSTALAAIPISPNVAAHSIIAIQGRGPIETGDDGVVSYQSAHIDAVQSEIVIRAGHSVQGDPQTVAEVRRILLLHLAEACPASCSPAVPPGGQPFASLPAGNTAVLGASSSLERSE